MQELERVLHDIDHSLSWIFIALLWMLLSWSFDCRIGDGCKAKEECEKVCGRKSYEEPPLEPHSTGGECWCFDPKTGKSERMW